MWKSREVALGYPKIHICSLIFGTVYFYLTSLTPGLKLCLVVQKRHPAPTGLDPGLGPVTSVSLQSP